MTNRDLLRFPALGSAGRLSHIFPRLVPVKCFPALVTGYMFFPGCLHSEIMFILLCIERFFIGVLFRLLFQIQVGGRSIVCSDVQQNVVCIGI